MSLSAVTMIKGATALAATAAVGRVITDVIKSNTAPVTKLDKVLIGVGSFVLGSALTQITVDYVAESIDVVGDTVKNMKDARKNKTSN